MPGTGLSKPWLAIHSNYPAQVAGSQRTKKYAGDRTERALACDSFKLSCAGRRFGNGQKNMPGTGLSEPWLAIHSNYPAQAAGSQRTKKYAGDRTERALACDSFKLSCAGRRFATDKKNMPGTGLSEP